MRAVVLGGNGLSGQPIVSHLRKAGNNVLSASRSSGVDLVTGARLAEAFKGADVVVDCSNGPPGGQDAIDFFTNGMKNVVQHAKEAGVKHVVLLSIAALPRTLPGEVAPGYLTGKTAQEEILQASGLGYTIIRAAQFYDFIEVIAGATTSDGVCHLPGVPFEPIDVEEVGVQLAKLAEAEPTNGVVNIVGPEKMTLPQAAKTVFQSRGVKTEVVDDGKAMMLNYIRLHGDELLLEDGVEVIKGKITLEQWLKGQSA